MTSLGGTMALFSSLAIYAFGVLAIASQSAVINTGIHYLAQASGGAVFGAMQFILLSPRVANAGWWVIVNVIGWIVGWQLGTVCANLLHQASYPQKPLGGGIVIGQDEYLHLLISGVVATLVLALFTGLALVLLLRKTRRTTVSST